MNIKKFFTFKIIVLLFCLAITTIHCVDQKDEPKKIQARQKQRLAPLPEQPNTHRPALWLSQRTLRNLPVNVFVGMFSLGIVTYRPSN